MYEYDFFVSYRRRPPVADWVYNHFFDLISAWLEANCAQRPRLFLDRSIETGVQWPEELRHALLHSKYLLPVLSPNYFDSPWCVAEFATMRQREILLGYRTADLRTGLIFPIRFSDGTHYEQHIRGFQYFDVSAWNIPNPAYVNSEEYLVFTRAIQAFAEQLSTLIDHAPPWDAEWPIDMPEVIASPPPRLPRLGSVQDDGP